MRSTPHPDPIPDLHLAGTLIVPVLASSSKYWNAVLGARSVARIPAPDQGFWQKLV